MAKTPEEVLETAYEDGCQMALNRGFTRVREVMGSYEITYSWNPAEQHYTWLTQIDKGNIFIDRRDVVGLVLGIEKWKAYPGEPTPCLIYSAVPVTPSTENSLVLVKNLPRLVAKQSLENSYGRWFKVSMHPNREGLSFEGSSAADTMGLNRGENRTWLLEDPGREALRAVVEDSFDLLAKWHRLISLVPKTSG